MTNRRILLGCVSREVPRVLREYPPENFGIVASYSQVGATAFGYTKWCNAHLKKAAGSSLHVWRDHASNVPRDERAYSARDLLLSDGRAGFYGAMIDWLPMEGAVAARDAGLKVEAGHGEDPQGGWVDSLSMCQAAGCDVVAVSTWLGTFLGNGKNFFAHDTMERCAKNVLGDRKIAGSGIALRAHNCDFLKGELIERLVDVGVTEFNFAPEIGKVLAVAVQVEHPALYEQAYRASHSDGRWRQWGPDASYGIHYVFERFGHMITDGLRDAIALAIREWLDERIEQIWYDE